MNLNEEIKPNNIQCYNCSDDMNIACDGKCFWCWQCLESQHINEENKMTEGHHINCNKHYDCNKCNKTTIKRCCLILLRQPHLNCIFCNL